jgi:hypothetical protein
MSSAAKAELGALYVNACKAVPMRQLLKEMGHKQPKTPIKTDNSTAFGVVTKEHPIATYKGHGHAFPLATLSQITKPIQVLLATRNHNQADYWTKHHCAAHHIKMRKEILTPKFILNALRASANRALATLGKVSSKQQMLSPLCDPT